MYPNYGQILDTHDVQDGRDTRAALDHHQNNIETHLHEAMQLLRALHAELEQADEMQYMLDKGCEAVSSRTRKRAEMVESKLAGVTETFAKLKRGMSI